MAFDINQPYNELPLLPPANLDLAAKEILIPSMEASEAIGALNVMLGSNMKNVLNSIHMISPLFVPEAVASSGVENIITTNEKVYEAQLLEAGSLKPEEKEALNYVGALVGAYENLLEKKFLSTNQFIAMQQDLEPKRAGLRKLPGTILSNPVTKEVYYTPPEGEALIRSLLANLEQYFNEPAPAYEIYARMAIMHYQFEAIHPFVDGNGRTGRMLMPLYLAAQERLEIPLLFISRYILANRDEYYAKLRAVTYKSEWEPWIIYIIEATTEQARYTTKVLERITQAVEQTRSQIKQKLPAMYSAELVEFIFSEPYFALADFERELSISYVTARKYLAVLEEQGLLMKKKQGSRGRFIYTNPQYIKILKTV